MTTIELIGFIARWVAMYNGALLIYRAFNWYYNAYDNAGQLEEVQIKDDRWCPFLIPTIIFFISLVILIYCSGGQLLVGVL